VLVILPSLNVPLSLTLSATTALDWALVMKYTALAGEEGRDEDCVGKADVRASRARDGISRINRVIFTLQADKLLTLDWVGCLDCVDSE